MKKKIIISFVSLFLLFFGGIVTTLYIINMTTANLNALLTLHKVEIIRQDLVISVQTVQSNLYTAGTLFGKELDIIVDNVLTLGERANTCIECHHDQHVEDEILELLKLTEQYKDALSYFITSTADVQRIQRLQSLAADIGDSIINKSQWMAKSANEALRQKTTSAMQKVSSSKRILAITLVFAVFVVILISLYLINSITKPVAELLNATRTIKTGNLQFRIEEQLKDEFRELASSFNEMAVSLQEQYQKLQQTERLAVVGELAAGMAHEIKNPLAGIKVSIEVLSQELELEQEDREIFLGVINEVDRINSLLNSLLSYARPPKPASVSFDVHEVLESTIKSAQYSLKTTSYETEQKRKKIDFVKDFSPDVPDIVADPSQLKQVFLNLILNAIDAIPERGTITVQTRKFPNETVEISISDNGKGMDSQIIDKIFNPFFTTKSNGTGLGLAVSKRLVEQHNGGSISVANNPYGMGVTFTITLPIKPQNENQYIIDAGEIDSPSAQG
ncbi:MAG: ATP-binding protein [Desulfobulbaceae bacterium]|nr:ATP-binding protein [Desulfobulbaceae bacterium]